MTNKEKAKDITKCLWYPQSCTEEDIQRMLLEMAQWKDEQFKQFLYNKKAFYHNHYQREAASAINDVLLDIRD